MMRLPRGRAMACVLACLCAGFAAPALAVHPKSWTFESQDDLADGLFTNVVVDNYGTLKLGRELQTVAGPLTGSFVNALAETKGGGIFAGTSPGGKIYEINDAKATAYFTPPAGYGHVMALAGAANGDLLAAVTGEKGAELLRLTPKGGNVISTVAWNDPTTSYVWAINEAKDGSIDLATGPNGAVIEVGADGKSHTLLETHAKNILSMTRDLGGNLIVGTDDSGLVIKIDAKTGRPFVLLSVGHSDITALTSDANGNLYVAAGQPQNVDDLGVDQSQPAPADGKPGTVTPDTQLPPSADDPDGDAATHPANRHLKTGGAAGHLRSAIDLPQTVVDADVVDADVVDADILAPDVRALLARIKLQATRHKPKAKHHALPGGGGADAGSRGGPDADDLGAAGNTVYKIAPDGSVSTLFKPADMLLSLAWQNGILYAGTGSDGKIYAINPTDQSQTLVARVDGENAMALLPAADGRLLIGTSNSAALYDLTAHAAQSGTYTSKVLDASHVASWGAFRAIVSHDAGLTIATRSGNTRNVDEDAQFWTPWSEPMPLDKGMGKIASPGARYLQYRITFKGDGKTAEEVSRLKIGYQVRNLPPVVTDVSVDGPSASADAPDASAGPPDNSRDLTLNWTANDPNDDTLSYRILYKATGSEHWVTIARNVSDTTDEVDTHGMADGIYIFKVIASDLPDNDQATALSAARQTSPVLVNNTPPVISGLKSAVAGNKVTVTGTAKDALSAVVDVRYRLDADEDWHPAAPSDTLFDSPSEAFTITTRPLAPGAHHVAIRVTDDAGNIAYGSQTVVVK